MLNIIIQYPNLCIHGSQVTCIEFTHTLYRSLATSIEAMHVFLKDGSQRRWVTNIYLKDGFCPYVGDEENRLFSDKASLEPAIWGKVLVLESISIDCNQRVVRWSTGNQNEGKLLQKP